MLKTALRALTVLLVSSIALSAAALASDRVALVIGNSAYRNATELPNPRNDATDIGRTLEAMGFEVISGIDLERLGMEAKVREFVEKSQAPEVKVALFFYAGHGMQVNGKNYLIPIDAKLDTATAIDYETIESSKIIDRMSSDSRVGIVLLDACRDNPLSRSFKKKTRSAAGDGLAQETSDGNMLIAFSTAPGKTALDGNGRNSPFTAALIKHLPERNQEFRGILTKVKFDVKEATQENQRPWSNDNFTTNVYLNGEEPGPGPDSTEEARRAWEAIKESKSPEQFDALAAKYPGTIYADFARARAKELRESARIEPDDQARKAWEAIKDLSNPEIFDRFAEKYDGTKYAELARKRAAFLRKPPSNARWFVITGSFPKGQKGKARQRLNAARQAGFEAVLVDGDEYSNLADGLLVVVIKAQSRDQAKSIEAQVKETFVDAYVKEAF